MFTATDIRCVPAPDPGCTGSLQRAVRQPATCPSTDCGRSSWSRCRMPSCSEMMCQGQSPALPSGRSGCCRWGCERSPGVPRLCCRRCPCCLRWCAARPEPRPWRLVAGPSPLRSRQTRVGQCRGGRHEQNTTLSNKARKGRHAQKLEFSVTHPTTDRCLLHRDEEAQPRSRRDTSRRHD